MYGYNGKILIVNLTDKSFETQDLNPEWAYNFIGGATLGARYLYELMPAKTDVFAPDSVVGFVSGPASGTKAMLSARITVVSKSPATGGWNDTNCGGSFAPVFRKSGFDAVFIKGASETPVYIFIDDGKPELRDASGLWGKTTSQSERLLRDELGEKISVMQIGTAGENLSYMAAVVNDAHRVAGRGGSGAVMGSKKLKALVCRGGSSSITVKDDAELMNINKDCIAHGQPGGRGEMPVKQFKVLGTSANYDTCVMLADAPIKNWLGAPGIDITEEQAAALTGRNTDPKYKIGRSGCSNCYIKCSAEYKVRHKKYTLEHTTRLEYESLGALGCMILNGDSDTAQVLNHLCNEHGYDTISFGATMAWLMECYEKGIFTKEELGGVDLKWGDGDAAIEMAERIIACDGIGAALNLASRGAARKLGKGEECTVTAWGMELPYHGSIFNPSLARTFQYDPSPGRHIKGGRGVPFGGKPDEIKFNYENTGADDVAGLLEWEMTDSCGICGFGNFLLAPNTMSRYVNAITGFDLTKEQLDIFALRSFTLRHAFNLRDGFRRKDFTLSDRAVGKPAMTAGPLKGITVDNEKLADNFYNELGWDLETTVPPRDFVEKLGGLEFLIGDLYPA